ncbi:MAG: pyruvate, phosphate dikinase [Candidatus Woesearchaeota archaeon]
MKKYVYLFEESKATPKNIFLLGNKGAQLAEMTSIGLKVPPGFTITTEACKEFYKRRQIWPKDLERQIEKKIRQIEKKTGKKFGDKKNPLLVSVRSGSYVSMPGMMDTVLNLGLNDETLRGFANQTNNERAAYDGYRRLIQMFAEVVMGVDHSEFEKVIENMKETKGIQYDTELSTEDLKKLVEEYKNITRKNAKENFPTDVFEQLKLSINAVFNSWNSKRAVVYRRLNKLRDDAGTAVNIQVMVFGNMGNDSGTGVGFTRDPSTGEKKCYGEYLINAQGEDVVAGMRTPKPISEMKKELPKVHKELMTIYDILEKHYKDMQDFEFTIEKGKLYILQARAGKRTAQAAVKIAVDMFNERLIDKKTAVLRVKPDQINQLLHKQIDPIANQKSEIIAKGLSASPGAAVGKAVFTAEKAYEFAEKGEQVILVRTETSPEDIEGMNSAQGILTARGGMTSHAAVVARGMGKCCVAGCQDIKVHEAKCEFITKNGVVIKEGDWISLDGSEGIVIKGKIPTVELKLKGDFKKIIKWADEFRKLGVRTNADTPSDAKKAREFGAEGIGLCRTEHMFFEGDRIKAVREMILAGTEEGRRKALAKLEPMQRKDFIEIFRVMGGLPVTIRLLDPPLHEFLPTTDKDIKELAKSMGIPETKLKNVVHSLHEVNPMLGFRGCRLGIVYPEINEMQVKAIFDAAVWCKKIGIDVKPEIMIPVLGHVNEMKVMKDLVEKIAKQVMGKAKVDYSVGCMIELPRSCVTADKIAEYAEFFSFGTNDLTQTVFGFSRDDAGKFIPAYVEKRILEDDPFITIDQDGVGEFIKMAVKKGRKINKHLKIGICGEQGGDSSSVEFCHKVGLDYVSCSPYRIPVAKLAAAHAALNYKKFK